MKVVFSTETLSTDKSTYHCNPGDQRGHIHRSDNLKSQTQIIRTDCTNFVTVNSDNIHQANGVLGVFKEHIKPDLVSLVLIYTLK
jgi:hypothetical protein